MSVLELECRITPEQYERIHAEYRARVRARYGPAARASADVPIRVEDFETPGADTDEVPF